MKRGFHWFHKAALSVAGVGVASYIMPNSFKFYFNALAEESLSPEDEDEKKLGIISHSSFDQQGNELARISLTEVATEEIENQQPIYRLAITGGPCSGKSTGIHILRNRLSDMGYYVLVLPEIATTFIGSGVKFPQFGPMTSEQILELQTGMIKAQIALEEVYYRLAKSSGQPSVILSDRGVIDGRAYMTPLEFQVMLDTNGWNLMNLRDQRYECVIHLVTAAIGAEAYYTLENNPARSESLYEAQMIDKKLREVYIGHPSLYVVNNSTGFEEKINRVVNIVGNVVGLPKRVGSRRKFVLKPDINVNQVMAHVPHETIEVEHAFLTSDRPNEQRGIRKRTHQHVNSYSIVYKLRTPDGLKESTVFRRLTPRVYMQFMKQRDPSLRIMKKETRSFVDGEHYYVLNRYKCKTHNDVYLLVVEASDEENANELIPSFLKNYIVREVTQERNGDSSAYSTYSFAKNDQKRSIEL